MTIKELRLSSNPFECGCDVSIPLAQLNDRIEHFWDFDMIQVHNCSSNPETEGRAMVNMGVQEATNIFCTTEFKTEAIYAFVCVAALALVLTAALAVVCLSERVRIWLYNNRTASVCFRSEGGSELLANVDEESSYDVFVSFAEEDSEYAAYLVATLENADDSNNKLKGRTYACCTHQRDWKAGDSIQTNIIQSVDR